VPATSGGSPSPGSDYESLLARVPEELRQGCYETTSFKSGALAGVWCTPTDVPIDLAYYSFDSLENLRAAFEEDAEYWSDGVEIDGVDCRAEPSRVEYEIDGAIIGELLCNNAVNGPMAIWTHEGLLISAYIQAYSGTFADLHEIWLTAGPD
jgi:hypothetical protein